MTAEGLSQTLAGLLHRAEAVMTTQELKVGYSPSLLTIVERVPSVVTHV